MSNTSSNQTDTPDRKFRHEPMIPVTICFAAGIVLDRSVDFRGDWLVIGLILAWIAWFLVYSCWPRRTKLASCLLFLMIANSGALWHHARWNWFPQNEIGTFAAGDTGACVLRGELITEPVRVAPSPAHPTLDTMRPNHRVRFLLNAHSIREGNEWKPTTGTVRASVRLSDEQSNGLMPIELPNCRQIVEVVGSLGGNRSASNPGQFDFRSHFRGRSQFAYLFADSTDAVKLATEESPKPSTLGVRSNLRSNIDQQLHIYLPPERAAFASAVLLGNRDQMDLETRNRFLKTGASHLLAISGLHVGILASAFLLLLRLGFVSRRNCLYLTILFVMSYAWLVEFRPTVLRAAILISVMCGARLMGRTALSWGSLTTALLLVLLFNPMDLFSLGTQLSFLAISTIIIGKPWIFRGPSSDPVDQLIARTRSSPVRWFNQRGREIRATFCVSLLIWLVGLPLVVWRFHTVALIAPLLNPLLLIPIAIALYAGLATIVCGTIAPVVTFVPATICSASLGIILWLIDAGASQPASHFWSSGPSGIAVAIFYAGLFVFAVFPQTKVPVRWCVVLAVSWYVFGWLVPERIAQLHRNANPSLEVTIIDVGHGSAALVRTPDGRSLLFDSGSLSGSTRTSATISNVLWRESISRLDAVVVSHADVDHFNALPELIDRFQVDEIWISPMMNRDDAESVATLQHSMQQHQVPVRLVSGGDRTSFGTTNNSRNELSIEFLGPPDYEEETLETMKDNALSLVAKIQWKGRTFLLPGDVEEMGMESLLQKNIGKTDVLVAAHHGSRNSDPERFTRWCEPDYVIVSCGAGKFEQQQSQLFRNGFPCEVLTTDRLGAIRCNIDRDGNLTVKHWDGQQWIEVNRL